MADDTWHGTLSGYTYHRCRCDECREAYRAYKLVNKDRIKARQAQYYIDNKPRIDGYNRAYYAANREREKAASLRRNRANPERGRAATARWRERNPGNPWREKNRDRDRANNRRRQQTPKAKQYQRAWRLANKDRSTIYTATWRKRNPAKVQRRSVLNRVGRTSEVLEVTERDWRRLCARYGNRCAYCDRESPLTQEHVVPLTRGGRHSIGNLLPACQSCNSSKNNKFLIEWRAALSR